MAAVSLQAPVALARLVDDLVPSGVKDLVWEPKWDGYRALVGDGRIFSRNGTNLTPLFPDLRPVLSARLPSDVVLDGEVIAWDQAAGRLDFEGLQARMTAGRRIRAVAARRPAQLVVFDVLAAGTEDLRWRPLRERRAILEQILTGVASPIVLCQQTDDVALAREWFPHPRRRRYRRSGDQGCRRHLPDAVRSTSVVEGQGEASPRHARHRVHR